MSASTPLVVTFAVYLLAMIAIGVIAWRSTRSFDDYILGGRSLGSYVTALSAGASDMSGWLLLGLPGALYLGGLSEGWIAVGLDPRRVVQLEVRRRSPARLHRAHDATRSPCPITSPIASTTAAACCACCRRW
jgi:hypothetical protein